MIRRQFVQQSTLAGSLLLMDPHLLFRQKSKHVGLQLYGRRDSLPAKPQEDPLPE